MADAQHSSLVVRVMKPHRMLVAKRIAQVFDKGYVMMVARRTRIDGDCVAFLVSFPHQWIPACANARDTDTDVYIVDRLNAEVRHADANIAPGTAV